VGLPDSDIFVLIQYRHVTDRRTDSRKDTSANIASHGQKPIFAIFCFIVKISW